MSIYNHKQHYPQGSLEECHIESTILKNNPLNDSPQRRFFVYLPADYEKSQQTLPVMYYLPAYTNSGAGIVAWKAFGENLIERLGA